MIDMQIIMESIARHRKALEEAWKLNKDEFFAALAAAEISLITVTFDGEGDSGQITNVEAYMADNLVALPTSAISLRSLQWNSDEVTVEQKPLQAAIEILCYDFLLQEHGGWENNDGAYGEFTFDVAARTVELEFHGRYTDVHTTTHTF
jgi:hypothetical protein